MSEPINWRLVAVVLIWIGLASFAALAWVLTGIFCNYLVRALS